jgi:hypothetical protein
MLKQTVESPDRKIVLYPGSKNTPVAMGSFQEFVFGREVSSALEFSYTWDLEKPIQAPKAKSNRYVQSNQLSFQASIKVPPMQNTPVLDFFKYSFTKNSDNSATRYSIMMKRASEKMQYKLFTDNIGIVKNKGRSWPLKSPIRFYGFPDEVVAYHQNAEFVKDYNLANEKLFKSIHYLGPLRTKAERLYSWAGIEPENVGYAGEFTIPAILAASERKINFGLRKRYKSFYSIIATELQKMGLIDSFNLSQVSELRQEYEVKIISKGSQLEVNLPDIGFGVSQVLPVIVQLFYVPKNSIIIMEQPEIHLHPSAQAALADVMIDALKSREGGSDRNIQLIIETHSEHFLRRIQRRIAEGDSISNNEVSAFFADANTTPASLQELQVNDSGYILNWPENFFGDEMEDIAAQSKAALLRRMDERI